MILGIVLLMVTVGVSMEMLRTAPRGGAGGALSPGPQLLEGPIHSQIKKK